MPRASTAVLASRYERYAAEPDTEISVSAQVARRMWAGEAISPLAIANEYHCSSSLPGVIVRELRQIGYVVETKQDQGRGNNAVTHQITGKGEPQPDPPPPRAAKKRAMFSRPRKVSELAPPPASTTAAYPLLGASLQVKALALRDDGVIMQLVDGNGGAWQVSITGHVG
jgi:hypothetical protein